MSNLTLPPKGRKKKILGNIIVILLVAGAFTSVFCSQTFAEEKEAPTLKVGYMDYNGFIDPQEDGSYTGYRAEYLAKISEYTGYNYEYVYGEWQDLL